MPFNDNNIMAITMIMSIYLISGFKMVTVQQLSLMSDVYLSLNTSTYISFLISACFCWCHFGIEIKASTCSDWWIIYLKQNLNIILCWNELKLMPVWKEGTLSEKRWRDGNWLEVMLNIRMYYMDIFQWITTTKPHVWSLVKCLCHLHEIKY